MPEKSVENKAQIIHFYYRKLNDISLTHFELYSMNVGFDLNMNYSMKKVTGLAGRITVICE